MFKYTPSGRYIVLRRKIYDELVAWKDDADHKALVIKGARQVGKTFIVREFAKENYEHYVELNFLTDPTLMRLFDESLSVDDLVRKISLTLHDDDIRLGCLIFLDEIQECPRARRTLKIFADDGRYDVIATGSMLGVSDSRLGIYKRGEPSIVGVGYEKTITMYALDFEEFLWARKVSKDTIDEIKDSIRNRVALDEVTYDVIMGDFRTFMLTGGMPEVVQHIVSGHPDRAIRAMDRILTDTLEDIDRYNIGVDVAKTKRCFDNIPIQLRDTNKKFTFSRMKDENDERLKNPTKQKYDRNAEWLGAAGYGNFCYLLTEPVLPLKAYEIVDQYRIYLFDTGMLTHIYGPSARMATLTDDYRYNQGAVAENIVAECLMKSGIQPRCYRKTNGKNRMELDFVIELGLDLCAIEVKSGKDRDFPSLRKVSDVFRIDRRIVLEKGNIFVDEEGIEHYPLFAAAFITDMIRERDGFDRNGLPIGGL